MAINRAHIPPAQMVAAIKSADPAQLNGVKASEITSSSVCVIRCIGPDEEPTEFECVWQSRGKRGWITHRSWLAIDGRGWHFID
jgi:hypothetical protein